ncbi:Guanosine-3',5'-bis(diphosphate) 3'-pyrophosphohydrolase / GTP pyrophosphokinase, (p)ppGpp synthetase II [hydrothermal vent metagenome]|uniref:Guanosine-3',5'-bis(Diphosphate) 3'-pyrophosphohydrolase / GTP pyrophosphokinase, (P)ppGpp synthetase II n=1 Tax=hydrothermal vent metagenome TaxID=652676 RepID=A0A3B0QXD5_9ZZZZ
MVRLEDILDKVAAYNPTADLEVIKKAYVFSAKVHHGQNRRSGEPYLTHPLEVASLLADLKMDTSVIATGLLHDTVEDTHTTVEKIEELFGEEVAILVDGLTKLSRLSFDKKQDREAENFRKMILAMSKDMRIVLIKLADRLHNMRTLDAMAPDKQRRIAKETLDIYAPLANRLGIGWIKTELEDLAFKYMEPEKYHWLEALVMKRKDEREIFIDKIKDAVTSKLGEENINGEVSGRVKHLYSIYSKMTQQGLEFDDIHDILAFRITVGNDAECYGVLGIVHSMWKPVPGRFKDYIALPKSNGYQSLHSTVVGPGGDRMEFQIRSEQMHRVSEHGVASHWKYKDADATGSKHDKSFAWLRQLIEWQRDVTDSYEFLETLKVDLFPEDVFIFTPQGEIKVFPVGATPVDLAYNIHTDVGNQCAGAKVNGKLVPLKHVLKNGDIVEVITSPLQTPGKEWLEFVVTSRARGRIRQWIKAEERGKSLELGRDICETGFKKYDLNFKSQVEGGELLKVVKEELGFEDIDAMLIQVGYGKLSVRQILTKFLPEKKLAAKDAVKVSMFGKVFGRFKGSSRRSKDGVVIKGIEDVMVHFAKCCSPLPGDDIAGFFTDDKGISVHHVTCRNILDIDSDRRIEVKWEKDSKVLRPVQIEVVCKDEKGLLVEMSSAIMAADANILSAQIKTTLDNRAACTFEVGVNSTDHLKSIIASLQKVKKVIRVKRISSYGALGDDKRAASIK